MVCTCIWSYNFEANLVEVFSFYLVVHLPLLYMLFVTNFNLIGLLPAKFWRDPRDDSHLWLSLVDSLMYSNHVVYFIDGKNCFWKLLFMCTIWFLVDGFLAQVMVRVYVYIYVFITLNSITYLQSNIYFKNRFCWIFSIWVNLIMSFDEL